MPARVRSPACGTLGAVNRAAPRLYVDRALAAGAVVDLPPAAARHVQVLRLQPGDAVTLFDGRGGEWAARIERIGRRDVLAAVGAHDAVEREAAVAVTLALGMPANDRMDDVVEKGTELGAAALQPLVCERSVLRPEGERAERRRAHWQAVAAAACEQCGRNRVPAVAPVRALREWLASLPPPAGEARLLLSLAPDAGALPALAGGAALVLGGPEGGLAPGEEAAARAAGFAAVSLGPRVLRADTAPLAALAALTTPTRQGGR